MIEIRRGRSGAGDDFARQQTHLGLVGAHKTPDSIHRRSSISAFTRAPVVAQVLRLLVSVMLNQPVDGWQSVRPENAVGEWQTIRAGRLLRFGA